MKTIAIIARKGGSGKTTVAVNLALTAHRSGLRTVVADMDPQASATEVFKARTQDGPPLVTVGGAELVRLQRQAVSEAADLLLIDTPAATVEEIGHGIAVCDMAVLVVRPTYLDLAAALQSAQILRSLRKPGLILLNQGQPPRGGQEPTSVIRAHEALKLLRLPVVPVTLRSRVAYQQALSTGRSVEEYEPNGAAADELCRAWSFIHRFCFGEQRKAG
jgi:chromosome partitioning protein